MKKGLLIAAVLIAVGSTYHVAAQLGSPENGMNTRSANGRGQTPAFAGQTRAPEETLNVAFDVVTVSQGLANPWGLAFRDRVHGRHDHRRHPAA